MHPTCKIPIETVAFPSTDHSMRGLWLAGWLAAAEAVTDCIAGWSAAPLGAPTINRTAVLFVGGLLNNSLGDGFFVERAEWEA